MLAASQPRPPEGAAYSPKAGDARLVVHQSGDASSLRPFHIVSYRTAHGPRVSAERTCCISSTSGTCKSSAAGKAEVDCERERERTL